MNTRGKQRRLLASTLDQLPQQRRYLFVISFIASLLSLQISYLALDDMTINLWLSLALAAGYVYSYFLEARFRPFTEYWVSAMMTGASLYYYYMIMNNRELMGNYLGVLAGVLMVLLAFRAFAPGDHRFILLLCTVILIFASVASYDLKFMLLLPVFLLAAGSTLYVASQVEVAARASETAGGELPPVTTVGRSFYRVLMRSVLGIVGLSIAAYIVTPHAARGDRSLIFDSAPVVDSEVEQFGVGDIQRAKDRLKNSDAEVGIGDDFDLTDPRRLSYEPRPVLQVKSHRNGYMRAQVYDMYTGTSWVRSPEMQKQQELKDNQAAYRLSLGDEASSFAQVAYFVPLQDFPSVTTSNVLEERNEAKVSKENVYSTDSGNELNYETIRQEVRLIEAQPPHYFAMFQPARMQNISLSQSGGLVDVPKVDIGGTVHPDSTKNWHPANFSYIVHSLEPRYTSTELKQVAITGPDVLVKHYTQLPQEARPNAKTLTAMGVEARAYRSISNRMANFAKQVVAERVKLDKGQLQPTPYQRVEAIYDYLTSSEFHYTRDYKYVDPSQELTESFCMGTQEGYCRHFASAMAVMCRINGIPARVVTGFAPGSFSLIDNAYIYKASNAHAWVEVYFDGYGWINFDPSPSSSDVFNKNDVIQFATGTVDFLQELFVLDPAATQQTLLATLKALWQTLVSYGPRTVAFLLLCAALVVGGVIWARRPRRKRAIQLTPENALVSVYLAVREQLARLGLRAGIGDTARTYLGQAAHAAAPLEAQLLQLLPLYEKAAFAAQPLTEDEAQAGAGIAEQVRRYVGDELARRKSEKRR